MDEQLGPATLRRLLAALDPGDLGDAPRKVWTRLTTWDGIMRADSHDAGLFAAWRSVFARRLRDHPRLRALQTPIAFDELFAPWTDPSMRVGNALDGLVAGLTQRGVELTPIAVAALNEAAVGDTSRPWGERHRLIPAVVSTDPVTTAAVAEIRSRVPLGGDANCVLQTASTPGVSDACTRGPVARFVWDVGDRTRSRWIVPFGASGCPGDPHYADQLRHWQRGSLLPIVTERAQSA